MNPNNDQPQQPLPPEQTPTQPEQAEQGQQVDQPAVTQPETNQEPVQEFGSSVPLNSAPDAVPSEFAQKPNSSPTEQPIPQPGGPSNIMVPAADTEQTQQPAPAQDAANAVPSKKLAVTSLVLGIIGFLTGFLGIGILLGIAAIIIGIFVLIKHQTGKSMAIGGIVTGALALLLGPVAFIIFLGSMASFQAVENSPTTDDGVQQEFETTPSEFEE